MRVTIHLLFLLIAATPALAEAPTPQARETAPAAHPLAVAVESLREVASERLEALETLRRGAFDGEARLRIEREIARTKIDFEIDVLDLQRGHQAALGRRAVVTELDQAIEALRAQRATIVDPGAPVRTPVENTTGEDDR